MKDRFFSNTVLCVLLCALISCNALVWTQIGKDKYNTRRLAELTDQYEQEILDTREQGRRTLSTHLLTMDAFLDEVRPIFEKQSFPEGVTAMIAFDGDNMGKIDEQYGDGAGNRLAIAFAETVKRHFPDSDRNIISNVGEKSDEFYMLLMGRKSKKALIREIDAFQKDTRKIVVLADDQKTDVSATISIGIAFYQEGEQFDDLFERADGAVYEAKEAGKNCYRVAKD